MGAALNSRVVVLGLWVVGAAPAIVDGFDLGGLLTIVYWVGIGVGFVGLMMPGAKALTLARIVVPANAVGLLVASLMIDERVWVTHLLTLAAAFGALVVVLTPAYGERLVDAASYGDERRFLLRPPAWALVYLVVPIWILTVCGALSGLVLLAAQRWVLGVAALIVGVPVAFAGTRALHQLSRRWLVYMPTALVLHDHLALAEPTPMARRSISSIGPAAVDTQATDLTVSAFGLALEIRLDEQVKVPVVTGRGKAAEQMLEAMLVSPSRPGAVLETATKRGISVR